MRHQVHAHLLRPTEKSEVHALGCVEMREAQLAESKVSSPEVKKFVLDMAMEHGDLQNRASAVFSRPRDSAGCGRSGALASWASCSESTSCNATAHDVIVFDDDAWPYNDPVNTLALTTVTYGADDGRIFEAYTEVNSARNQLTTAEPPPTNGARSTCRRSSPTRPATGRDQPTADDITAICAVYPPQSASKGCACTTAGTPRSVPSMVARAFAGLCILLTRRLSKCDRAQGRPAPKETEDQ
jgi:hypothetical protein